MSYSTRAEVREMIKDDALNAIIGDTFIEEPAKREELVAPIIDAAIADADGEIDGYLAKRYAVPLSLALLHSSISVPSFPILLSPSCSVCP